MFRLSVPLSGSGFRIIVLYLRIVLVPTQHMLLPHMMNVLYIQNFCTMLFSMFTVHREAFSPANFFILTRCFSLVNIFFLLFVHFSFHSPDSSDGRSLCLRAWSSLQRTFIYYHRSASRSIVFYLQLIFSELQFADKERSRTSFRLYCYQYNP